MFGRPENPANKALPDLRFPAIFEVGPDFVEALPLAVRRDHGL